MSLIEKRSVFQCLGNLIKKPELLEDVKYKFEREDFTAKGESMFYVIIFAAINNLYDEGVENIDVLSIDSYLSAYSKQYAIFNENNGIEYLQNAIEQSHEGNFDYNYNKLKKFSLLREYDRQGFDIKDVYDNTIMNPREQEEMMTNFDKMSIKNIVDHYDKKQLDIKHRFVVEDKIISGKAGEGAKEQLQRYKESPDYGISLIGNMQNAIFRGAQTRTIGMRSAPSNLGKTRISLSEAVDMAIDEWYNLEKREWTHRGQKENVLFISSETEKSDLEPTMWAYISGVPEEVIKDGTYNSEEEERLERAIEILESSGLWIDYIPDFDTDLIESRIKQHIFNNNLKYVFFDYVHISTSVMEELASQGQGVRLREDMVLFMFVDRLEKICKQHDVWLRTASQVNGSWKDSETADSTMLRGAKNMADRLNFGIIMLNPTKKELDAVEPILRDRFGKEPNVVYHIYKNRATRYKDCKLWLHIDYDTMRQEEMFLTNNRNELIHLEPVIINSNKETVY